MLNCINATRLISQMQDENLAVSQRLVLRWHLLCCSGCRNFLHQLGDLRVVSRAFAMGDDGSNKP